MKKLLATLGLVACTLAAVDANAAAINGYFSATGLGTTSYEGADLNVASQLNVAGTWQTTNIDGLYQGLPNDMLGLMTVLQPGPPPVLPTIGNITNPILINGFIPVTGFMVWGDNTSPVGRFSFDLATLVRNASDPGAMDLYGTGTFRDASTTGFDDGAAAFRLTAQQVGGGSPSYSFSWGSPPFDNPAPGVLWLLGAGFMGLAAARRRNRT